VTRTLAAVALVVSSAAGAFPDFDPARELVIVGDPAFTPDADQRGAWHLTNEGLSLQAAAEPAWSYWLPTTPVARVADGLVRARLRAGARLDSSVLVRARVAPDDARALSGYGVSLERDAVQLHRWDAGLVHALSPRVKVAGLHKRARVEVVVFLVGAHLSAFVFDADTLDELASLTAHDATYSGGRVGLRAHARQGADTALEHLSVHAAGLEQPLHARASTAPAGEQRRVDIARADEERLPALLRKRVVERDGARATLVTDARGVERLRRAGITPLEVSGEVPWRLRDRSFRQASARGVQRTRSGFVIDDSYKDAAMVEALLRAYAARFAHIARLVEIGRSTQGRAIWALKISDHPERDEDEPAVLLNAAHHGSELMSVAHALDVVQQLLEGYGRDAQARRFVDGLELWLVPLVNPDGNHGFLHFSQRVGRKNGRDLDGDGVFEVGEGVDLNRNYPFRWGALGERGSKSWPLHSRYRGEAPASEPEVRAIMALARRERFCASISFHTAATLILSPYTIDDVRNPAPDVAWQVAEAIAARLPVQPNGKRFAVQRNIYSVDGTDQDWLMHEIGTLALLVEGPLHNPASRRLRRRAVATVRPAWKHLLSRVLDGPTLFGHVRDEAGAPIDAEVRVLEIAPRESERWTARPRDGRFDRLLPAPGTYRVQAIAPGYRVVTATVDVDGPTRVELTLPKETEHGHEAVQ
jgi:hypothetical protein